MIKRIFNSLLAGVFFMTPAGAQVTKTEVPDIYGSVIFALGWEDMPDAPYGIYSIKGGNGTGPEKVLTDSKLKANGGGVYADGLYHLVSYEEYPDGYSVYYRVYDVDNSWKLIYEKPLSSLTSIATDLTFNPADGKIYGCFNDGQGGYFLGTLDELTGKAHSIAALEEQLMTISANRTGEIYGVGAYGNLYKVNPATAELTAIGSTGKTIRYAQSATFDYRTDKLYWVMTPHDFQADVKLCEINTANASVTELCNVPDRYEFTGIFTFSPYALPDAANAVTDVQLNYPQGVLNGTLTFRLPSVTFSGESMTGYVGYTVNIDGEDICQTSAEAGTEVSLAHEFERGMHFLKITPYNAAGRGSAYAAYIWAGTDIPKAENPSLTLTETTASIKWQAPSKGVNGGYIDPGKLTYRVLRRPDGINVYEGNATSTTDDISTLEYSCHWYDILTLHDGIEGETASTEKTVFGQALSCPYNETFTTENCLDTYTVIDSNKDNCTWQAEGGEALYGWNDGVKADDWLITPPVRLEKDNVYKLSFDIRKEKYYSETLEVSMGDAPDAEGMKEEILAPTVFSDSNVPDTEFLITAVNDRNAYFGFHILSDHETGAYLYLDNVSVERIAHTGAPAAPSLSVSAGKEGHNSATVSCTLPSMAVNGTPLSEIKELTIRRDGGIVQVISDVKPGQSAAWTDGSVTAGTHVYEVTAANGSGHGLPAKSSVYIGEDIPGPVRNIRISDLGNGNTALSWDAPAKGKNGGYVNPQSISYNIYNIGGDANAKKTVSSTSITDMLTLNENEQATAWYVIEASNNAGTGEAATSDTIFVGDAYALPYNESFAKRGTDKGPWGFGQCERFRWSVASTGVYTDPQDGDGGMAEFGITNGPGGVASLVSPKISLTGTENPCLSFYVWHHAGADNRLKVSVRTGGGEKAEIALIDQSDTGTDGDKDGWVRYIYNLSEFRNSGYVQIVFTGMNITAGVYKVNELYLDNVSVVDVLPHDLAVISLEADQKEVETGAAATFWLSYENKGYNTAGAYTLRLFRDGKEVSSVEGESIRPYEKKRVRMTDLPNGKAPKSSLYTAFIDFGNDKNPDNNTSDAVVMSVLPGKPYVNNLEGTVTGSSVVLSWGHPEGSEDGSAQNISESFEDYEAFIISNIGEWSLNDADGSSTAGIQDGKGDFIQYPNVGKPMAFQVFCPSEAGLTDGSWMPHSGKQVLAAFTSGYSQNDDWLISPELDGKQVISFWACSPENTLYGTNEVIEVLYSATGKEPSDFKKTAASIVVPGAWTRYEYELPESVKHFAIRCVSSNQYVLFIDDISFRAAARDFSLTGYNVYRNGDKLNPEPITETTYTDTQADLSSAAEYYVTAVYNIGESVPSNTIVISPAGIGDAGQDLLTVHTGRGTLTVSNAGNRTVRVFSAGGHLIHTAKGDINAGLPSGIYIVKVNDKTIKVSVR